jgi:hypothetical protein
MTLPDLDRPISPLRQRLIDDMNMRRFSRETQRNYLCDIGRLATFLGRSPDTATADDLRRFQIEQQEDGVPVPTMNSIVSARASSSSVALACRQLKFKDMHGAIEWQPDPTSFRCIWRAIDNGADFGVLALARGRDGNIP